MLITPHIKFSLHPEKHNLALPCLLLREKRLSTTFSMYHLEKKCNKQVAQPATCKVIHLVLNSSHFPPSHKRYNQFIQVNNRPQYTNSYINAHITFLQRMIGIHIQKQKHVINKSNRETKIAVQKSQKKQKTNAI